MLYVKIRLEKPNSKNGGNIRMLTEQKYKDLSIKEFTKAAEVYDSGHAGLYEMCQRAGIKSAEA